MRPKTDVVLNGETKIYPTGYREGEVGIVVTPDGGSTYTVEFTPARAPGFDFSQVTTWAPVPDMTAATTQQSTRLGPVTAIRVQVTSGTSVTVDIAQRNV